MEGSTYAAAAAAVRGRRADGRPGRRPGRRRRLPRRARAWTASPRTSTRSSERCSTGWPSARGCASRPGRPQPTAAGAVAFVVDGRARPRRRPGARRRGRRRPGRAPLRLAAAPPVRRRPRRPARSFAAYNTLDEVDGAARRARPGARGLRGGGLMDLYQELILEHSKRAAPRRAARAVRRRGAPRQPDLRRRGHAARAPRRHRRRRASSPTCRTTPWAAPSPPRRPRVLTDQVIGRPCAEALASFEAMRDDAHQQGRRTPATRTSSVTASPSQGVSKYPARVKCALLGWTALTDALLPSGALGRAQHTDRRPCRRRRTS